MFCLKHFRITVIISVFIVEKQQKMISMTAFTETKAVKWLNHSYVHIKNTDYQYYDLYDGDIKMCCITGMIVITDSRSKILNGISVGCFYVFSHVFLFFYFTKLKYFVSYYRCLYILTCRWALWIFDKSSDPQWRTQAGSRGRNYTSLCLQNIEDWHSELNEPQKQQMRNLLWLLTVTSNVYRH